MRDVKHFAEGRTSAHESTKTPLVLDGDPAVMAAELSTACVLYIFPLGPAHCAVLSAAQVRRSLSGGYAGSSAASGISGSAAASVLSSQDLVRNLPIDTEPRKPAILVLIHRTGPEAGIASPLHLAGVHWYKSWCMRQLMVVPAVWFNKRECKPRLLPGFAGGQLAELHRAAAVADRDAVAAVLRRGRREHRLHSVAKGSDCAGLGRYP